MLGAEIAKTESRLLLPAPLYLLVPPP